MAKKQVSKLHEAAELAAIVQNDKKTDVDYKIHSVILNGQLVATNGIVSCGCPIGDHLGHLYCVPNTRELSAALKTSADIKALDYDGITLNANVGRLRAKIQTIEPSNFPFTVYPDVFLYQLPPEFLKSIITASLLSEDKESDHLLSTVCLMDAVCVGTNRSIIIQVWHGYSLPSKYVIPVEFVKVINRVKKNFYGIGVSETSLTVYYDDGAWIKTQLSSNPWPDILKIFEAINFSNVPALPKSFFDDVKSLKEFSKDDPFFYIKNGKMSSTEKDNIGASYSIKDSSVSVFPFESILALRGVATALDMSQDQSAHPFTGENVRGIIAKTIL